MRELLDAWAEALAGADADAVASAGRGLIERWSEPHRRYHTVEHLRVMLDVIDESAGYADDADAVRLAAWFHDAIYDPTEVDNEERSADLVTSVLSGLDVRYDEVVRLVLLTKSHEARDGDRNAMVLCDADLAILAAPPDRYRAYADAIREEYRHVPDDAFRTGRAAVLRNLLALPRLFHLHPEWEGPARANLSSELSGGADRLP